MRCFGKSKISSFSSGFEKILDFEKYFSIWKVEEFYINYTREVNHNTENNSNLLFI